MTSTVGKSQLTPMTIHVAISDFPDRASLASLRQPPNKTTITRSDLLAGMLRFAAITMILLTAACATRGPASFQEEKPTPVGATPPPGVFRMP